MIETWLASHVCKKVYTCAPASSSSLYFGYVYDMLSLSTGHSDDGISTRLFFLFDFWSGGGVGM